MVDLLLHLYYRTLSASDFLKDLYKVGFLTSFLDRMSAWLYIFNLPETPSEGFNIKQVGIMLQYYIIIYSYYIKK